MEASKVPTGGEKMARGTMAAILAASGLQCDCEPCKILKGLAGDLKTEFLR